jgi:MFS transporter
VSAAQEAHLAGPAASYRGLFAEPWARWLALADVCARLPQGMVTVTLLLVAAQHASMRVAGLVVAGYTLAQAASGPLRGRLADRRGLAPVAALCTLGYALALLALLADAPAGLLIGTAVAAGLRSVRVQERRDRGEADPRPGRSARADRRSGNEFVDSAARARRGSYRAVLAGRGLAAPSCSSARSTRSSSACSRVSTAVYSPEPTVT